MMYILGDYSQKKAEQGITVVLLPVSLPQLQDPINGVFREGCGYAYDNTLRATHGDELRELLQDPNGKTELVLFLDAYDELAPSALWK